MTGADKFHEAGEKIKKDVAQKNELKKAEESKDMEAYRERLRAILQDDARKDVRESGGSLPFLSVFVGNRSTSVLADGTIPTDGWFVYSRTQEQIETPFVHICHISRGFRVLKKDEKGNDVPKYIHLVSGLLDGDEKRPFFMTFSGSARLERLWEFRDVLKKLNVQGFPTYSLLIKLSSENVKIKQPDGKPGVAKVINFAISRNEKGEPDIELDELLIYSWKNAVEELKQFEQMYMDRYEVDKNGQKIVAAIHVQDDEKQILSESTAPELQGPDSLPVGDDDIPY